MADFKEHNHYQELSMMIIFFLNFIWLKNNKINKKINKFKNQGQQLTVIIKSSQLKIVQI